MIGQLYDARVVEWFLTEFHYHSYSCIICAGWYYFDFRFLEIIMNIEQDQVANVDLDGTLCDYNGQLLRDLKAIAGPDDPEIGPGDLHHCSDWLENRINLIRKVPGWWRGLSKLPAGFEILRACQEIGFKINIFTKGPDKAKIAWTEKFEWCDEHVKPIVQDYQMTITQEKSRGYGKVLVDDFPPYMNSWLARRPRGLGIMPEQPWNFDYKHPQVIVYTRNNFDEVAYALRKAYNRLPREA